MSGSVWSRTSNVITFSTRVMVLCKHLDGPMVELTQPYANVLKYDNKLYEIDKDIQKSFVLDSVCSINADADSLYTMFYIGYDGTVSEAVHLRCRSPRSF